MIFVGIDVAKDKHDCFIISSEGEVLADVFTVPNSKEGFEALLQTINTSYNKIVVFSVPLQGQYATL